MNKKHFKIENIPAVLWGEESDKLFIAVHGFMGNKEDSSIEILAEEAVEKGYQVISIDLPEPGERNDNSYKCNVQNSVHDLNIVINYAKKQFKKISVFGCSLGAYFNLMAYKNEDLYQAVFLSPLLDMERMINNMMKWNNVSEEQLEKEKVILTPDGLNLYWDYYCYVKENPVDRWTPLTSILYGSKDTTIEFDTIKSFKEKFNCNLEILESSEHYFHTEEQFDFFRNWLKREII